MYSDRIVKLLHKAKVELGDRIIVHSKGTDYEGELMPKTAMGDPNTIIIKLENGYNVGILADDETKVHLVSRREKVQFPKAEIKGAAHLPKVTIIYTGGTIGSKIDYKTGGTHPLIDPAELLYEVPELSKIADLEIKKLMSIFSEDMSFVEWQKIARAVKEALGHSRGVVITMGTDTMHYTAAALSFMLSELNAPVIITGAQRSSDRGSSDAFLNLSAAVHLAANSVIAGVGICMHASSSDDKCELIRGTRARKMHTSRRDAFRPINDRAIAYVDRGMNISYNSDYKEIDGGRGKMELMEGFEERVALVKVHPNSNRELIDFYIEKRYKGMILEGTGLGNLPATWLPAVKKAVKKGMIVGIASQCTYGRVSKNVYSKMREISELGVVNCEDMLSETAYIKLAWLLGNYKSGEAREMLGRNLVGEMKDRTEYDEFLL